MLPAAEGVNVEASGQMPSRVDLHPVCPSLPFVKEIHTDPICYYSQMCYLYDIVFRGEITLYTSYCTSQVRHRILSNQHLYTEDVVVSQFEGRDKCSLLWPNLEDTSGASFAALGVP